MAGLTLVIGNKNYSSWSLRGWLMARAAGIEFEEVPLDGMRSTIARRLVEAKQTIPHFYLVADVTMDALLKIREEANAGAPLWTSDTVGAES